MPNWKKLIVSGSDASLNSLEVNQASGSFSGSFQGDGSQLTGITVDAATTVEDSFTSQTSISITHNFETKNIIVSVYNSDDEQIIPQSVTTTTNNTVDIVFQSATSGRVVVVRGGHILSGSAATASLALELSNLATASFAITASHALNIPDTASHALTAVTSSIADELSQLATASFANNATSASYALYAVSASHEIVLETSSSFAETASLAINLSPEATASQADNATTASFAITASHALNVPATSSHALTAVSASIADELSQLATASFAITASHALNVPDTASHALTAVTASHTAGTASIANNAVTASNINPLTQDVSITGSLSVSGNVQFADILGVANEIVMVGSNNSITSSNIISLDPTNNYLGINQPNPEVTLHMTGDGAQTAQIRMEQYNDSSDAPDIRTRKARGTSASPAKNNAGDFIYRQNSERYNGSTYTTVGQFAVDANSSNADRFQLTLAVSEDGNTIDAAAAQFKIDGNDGGAITFNDAYKFPTSDGTLGQTLITNGSGVLSFGTVSTASHALTAVTASHALNVPDTSSFSLNADSASVAARATTLSADATASIADRATTSSFADLAGNSRNADSSSVAARATTLSADATASIADRATTASFADLAGDARTADSASVAARATELSADATASFADRATSASIADDIKDGAVTNAKLVNDSITLGTTEVTLGTTIGTLSGLDAISATTGTFVLQIYESSSTIITSGSNIFGNDQNDIQQITGSLKQSGSYTLSGSLLQSNGTISGSFEGNGSGLTGITADSADSSSVAARATTLSTDATASFALVAGTSRNADSASVAARATELSTDATASFADLASNARTSDSASVAARATELSADATASFADLASDARTADSASVASRATTLSADATASHALTAVTASHTAGTASISNYATSASFAITASYLLGGAGNSGSFSGSFQGDGSELTGITVDASTLVNATFTSQTSLTASHELDSTNLIITVFNTDNEVLIPENIRILDNSNVGFDFATSTSGKYVLAKGGHIVSGSITTTVSEQTTVTASFVDQTSYTASHAFESKDVNVIIYGVNDELLIPQTIKTLNSSSVGVDFAESTSGRIVITKGGHFVSGSIASASIADVATLARAGSGSFSGSFQGDGSNLTGVASPTGSFSGSFTGSILVSDHILPTSNEAYDLGSPDKKFRDLYLSGSTIYLDDVALSKNTDGNLEVKDSNGNFKSIRADEVIIGNGENATRLKINNGRLSAINKDDSREESIELAISSSFSETSSLSLSSSYAITASYVLNADRATSASIADELSQLATASFALTASHALNGGGGNSGSFSGSFQGDGSSLTGIVASVVSESIAADSFTSQTSYTASHNFGTKEVVVQVYDNNDNVIVPSNIRAITDNAVGLDFASSRTGKVIISKGGHIVTGSVIATASVAEGLSPSAQRQSVVLATSDFTGSFYSLHIISSSLSMSAPPTPQPGDWFKISQRVPSGSNFTSSLLFGNGSQIMSASTELELDVEDQGIEFIYADATQGWVIIGN